jgi:hypothetical protein
MATKREWVELPKCHQCGGPLENSGAESQGDGDIYDLLCCAECGPAYEWHATYCRCDRCGGQGDRLINVIDPNFIPMPIPWY